MKDTTEIERQAHAALSSGNHARVLELLDGLSRPLTTNEAAYLGSALISEVDMPRSVALLQQAADGGHYIAARNLVFITRDNRFPTHSPSLAAKYHKRATELWQAPWKTFMGMAASTLRPLGFRKRDALFWRRRNALNVIEVRKSRWSCDFDIRLGRDPSPDLVPRHIEECSETAMMKWVVHNDEAFGYTCEFHDPEIRVDDMNRLLESLVRRAMPWFEGIRHEPNQASHATSEPAPGAASSAHEG